ncbi:MAG: AraC family transcriptional regulator [Gammaproteobacteria bacterium]|jgi:O-6-methylguanine DNA methyltransferase|nr:AraC family transcriptional regulator [Gammaproteobacteria bacterium]
MDFALTTDFAPAEPHITTPRETPSGEIAFATGQSILGTVMVARSARGVCAILIGAKPGELEGDLAARFPENTLFRDSRGLDDDLQKILHFIEAPARGLELALDVYGTPFQRRVWDALCGIPSGRTVTYAALARRIGEPGAVRAVANACAANAIALAIPCHRVVRSDGTISGYRWGVERKRALLAREAAE